jgi:hypothetical protein
MLQMLLASENLLFSAALMLLVLIALAELSALLIGQSLSGSFDSLLPDTDITPHAEVGAADADTALSRLLGWLRIGEVPLLMLLVIFLLNFGLLGLLLQGLFMALLGFYLPGILAGFATFFLVLPCVRFWGGVIEKVMPRDETTAVSAETLVGRIGVITLGTARTNTPAEAKVKDEHGFSHYLQVIPDNAAEELPQGSVVLVVSRESGTYKVIKNPNPYLNDQVSNLDPPNH